MLEPFPDQGAIPFVRQRDAGGVVNAVVAFMRQNAREVFVGYLALIAPLSILTSLSAVLWQTDSGAFEQTEESFDPGLIGDMFGPSYWSLLVTSGVLFAISQAAVAAYARLYREGYAGTITPGVLWNETKGLIMPVVGMSLLLFGAFLALSIVGAMLIAASIGLLGIGIGGFVGALIVVGVACWSMPYVHVAFASRMTEATTVFESIGRAFTLVRGAWLRSFGSVFLPWIVAVGLLLGINILAGGIAALVGINSLSEDPGSVAVITGLIGIPFGVIGTLAYILPALASFFLHGSLADDLDGPSVDDDLDLLERGFDATPATGWAEPDESPRASGAPKTPSAAPTPPPASGARSPEPGPTPEAPPSRGGFRGGGFS